MKRPRGPATRPEVVILGAGHRIGGAATDGIPHMSVHNAESDASTPKPDSVGTPTKTEGLTTILASMSEKVFQAHVVDGLRQRGYVVFVVPDMRKSEAGWPDLAFWHPHRPGVLHVWELKTMRGRVTPKQALTLRCLASVPGVDARIVRPGDWAALRDALDAASPGVAGGQLRGSRGARQREL